MRPLFAGIKRKEHYSPNHRNNDALILQKTAKELEKLGVDTILYSEDDIISSNIEADLFFSMARSSDALNKLADMEKKGITVINSTQSSYNCHRVNMIQKLGNADVTIPKSHIVKTDSNIQYKLSVVGKDKIWIKRGDVHAIHREDVTLVYSDEQLNFVLNEFKLRGITDAILQEHLEGDVVKFYSVKDTEFFYWYYLNGRNKYDFNFDTLKSLANKSAEVMDLLIYGGDAIIEENGKITIIDINDWPSFAPIRDEASKFIAKAIYARAAVNKEGGKNKQLVKKISSF